MAYQSLELQNKAGTLFHEEVVLIGYVMIYVVRDQFLEP